MNKNYLFKRDEESIIIYHANHKFAISFYKMISELLDMGFDVVIPKRDANAIKGLDD